MPLRFLHLDAHSALCSACALLQEIGVLMNRILFVASCRGEDKEEFLDKLEAREIARAEEIKKSAALWKHSLKQ